MSAPTVVRIDDAGDPRLAAYRDIRERDLVGRHGRFVAEGEVVLATLLEIAPERVESVLLAEGGRVERLLGRLAALPAEAPVYLAPPAVMDGVAGFAVHRGVLAIGRRGEAPGADALLRGLGPQALVVGLVGLSNHDNVGGVFRNAAAFGADAVLLDETSCDPLYRKAIRVSTGAVLRLPWSRGGSAREMAQALRAQGFRVLALTPSAATPLHEIAGGGRVAVLFGAEGPGLPAEALAQAEPVAIRMAAGVDSLNVATTSGVVLHHLSQQRLREH